MTLLFDKSSPIASPALAPASGAHNEASTQSKTIHIGLVNNMPDAAMAATERQFAHQLQPVAGARVVLHCFALPSVPRSAASRARMAGLYAPIDALARTQLDGLIVTGAEPQASELKDEAYWADLVDVIDGAAQNTRSTIWSCLAAHAVALHLDGVVRRRLPRKCSGVYQSRVVAETRLTRNLPARINVAHSRLNRLDAADLEAAGYTMLTQSETAGVDAFGKRVGRSDFVFFQGHPEYEAGSLQREYIRDIGRYLHRQCEDYPDMPENYFDKSASALFAAFRATAERRRDPTLMADVPRPAPRPDVVAATQATAALLFQNWLSMMKEPQTA